MDRLGAAIRPLATAHEHRRVALPLQPPERTSGVNSVAGPHHFLEKGVRVVGESCLSVSLTWMGCKGDGAVIFGRQVIAKRHQLVDDGRAIVVAARDLRDVVRSHPGRLMLSNLRRYKILKTAIPDIHGDPERSEIVAGHDSQ